MLLQRRHEELGTEGPHAERVADGLPKGRGGAALGVQIEEVPGDLRLLHAGQQLHRERARGDQPVVGVAGDLGERGPQGPRRVGRVGLHVRRGREIAHVEAGGSELQIELLLPLQLPGVVAQQARVAVLGDRQQTPAQRVGPNDVPGKGARPDEVLVAVEGEHVAEVDEVEAVALDGDGPGLGHGLRFVVDPDAAARRAGAGGGVVAVVLDQRLARCVGEGGQSEGRPRLGAGGGALVEAVDAAMAVVDALGLRPDPADHVVGRAQAGHLDAGAGLEDGDVLAVPGHEDVAATNLRVAEDAFDLVLPGLGAAPRVDGHQAALAVGTAGDADAGHPHQIIAVARRSDVSEVVEVFAPELLAAPQVERLDRAADAGHDHVAEGFGSGHRLERLAPEDLTGLQIEGGELGFGRRLAVGRLRGMGGHNRHRVAEGVGDGVLRGAAAARRGRAGATRPRCRPSGS